MTTLSEIKQWFDEGVSNKHSFLIVAADLFDYEDYPIYTSDNSIEFWQKFDRANDSSNMQAVMEVYDLRKGWDNYASFPTSTRHLDTPLRP